MKFSFSLSLLFFSVVSVAASPSIRCLSDSDADNFVKAYQGMLAKVEGWQDIAHEYLRPDIISTSDSDAFENQIPLNTTSYNGLDAWITKLEGQMGVLFETLVLTHNCDTITWYQVFNQGGAEPVRAISIWFVDTSVMKIYKHFWEHNSGLTAWLQGYVCSNYSVTVGQGLPERERANCKGLQPL